MFAGYSFRKASSVLPGPANSLDGTCHKRHSLEGDEQCGSGKDTPGDSAPWNALSRPAQPPSNRRFAPLFRLIAAHLRNKFHNGSFCALALTSS